MKFVDEAKINIAAGSGGAGCVSFLRARFIPRGGPDGGDGGDGGSVWLQGHASMNTLADFRNRQTFRAENGARGEGKNRNGRKGKDLIIAVPVGTVAYNDETGEVIGDIDSCERALLVAKGGQRGVGNTRFKSAANKAPRRATPGDEGERRALKLELKLLADVGLLGKPNAGKSTLLAAVSGARPKIADYPFTTLHPILGVAESDNYRSFVLADIPGLIEGAAGGSGLGIRFLRHLQRTNLLLHLLDLNDCETAQHGKDAYEAVARELALFDKDLAAKECWLVFTKSDTLDAATAQRRCADIIKAIQWGQPWFLISSVARKGLDDMKRAIMDKLEDDKQRTRQSATLDC